jgi:hypothetical protein
MDFSAPFSCTSRVSIKPGLFIRDKYQRKAAANKSQSLCGDAAAFRAEFLQWVCVCAAPDGRYCVKSGPLFLHPGTLAMASAHLQRLVARLFISAPTDAQRP